MKLSWLTVILLLANANANANANSASLQDETRWGLGVGLVSTQKPYRDINRDNTPIPLLYVENRYFRFLGTELEAPLPVWQLSESQQLQFSVIGRYDGSGYKADDSPALEGMAERKSGVWAGARAAWQSDWLDLHADWTHDISGNSNGQEISAGVERSWQISNSINLAPRISAVWSDSKSLNYYYGVRDDEVRSGRAAWQGGSGVTVEVGMQGVYEFTRHQSLIIDFKAARLPSAVSDSPLVDRSNENRLFIGYHYHF